METITQKYNKYLKDLLPRKPEDTNPLSLSSVTFSPPPANILQYFNSIKSSEQKGSNYQSLNSSLSFEELPDEIKYTIEEEYHNELLSFDTTLKDLKNSLVNEYRKKYLTAEELFLSVEIEKAENEKRDVVNARIKAEMTWESLPDTKKNYWEKLRLICAQFWSQSLSITFFNTFFDFYQNTQSKLKNGEISRDKLNQLKEKYFQFKALTLKRMSTWLLANRIQFVKKSDLVYYNVWKCDDLIEQILNEDLLKAPNKQTISQKDKEAFEKFLTPIRLTEQFVNYMVKNEVSYEMRQKYTPLYMFYLEKKDILSSLDVSIEEKMKFIEAEWSKLKEEEKRKYTLQVYDKLYNSTIALYKEEISKSNMATAKKRITFSNRKFKLEDSDDEDYFSESEEEKTLVEESEETVTTIKKRKINREEMIQYIKENYKKAKQEFPTTSKEEILALLIFRYKKSLKNDRTKSNTKENKENVSSNKKRCSLYAFN